MDVAVPDDLDGHEVDNLLGNWSTLDRDGEACPALQRSCCEWQSPVYFWQEADDAEEQEASHGRRALLTVAEPVHVLCQRPVEALRDAQVGGWRASRTSGTPSPSGSTGGRPASATAWTISRVAPPLTRGTVPRRIFPRPEGRASRSARASPASGGAPLRRGSSSGRRER